MTGVVRLSGDVPSARTWTSDEPVKRICGHASHSGQNWLIGESRGLANCVVTLHAENGAPVGATTPTSTTVLEKTSCGYSPHVLVAPTGTAVLLRNRDSPCMGFHGRPRRSAEFQAPSAREGPLPPSTR